ncbi:MAG: hypothetical protein ACRELG_24220, partial [Gemmataceae bacterium]
VEKSAKREKTVVGAARAAQRGMAGREASATVARAILAADTILPGEARQGGGGRQPRPATGGKTAGAQRSRKWLIMSPAVVLFAGFLVLIMGVALKNRSSPAHDTAPSVANAIGKKPAPNAPTTVHASKPTSRLPIEWTRYPSSEMLESKLKQVIDYCALDDPRTTLDDELKNLEKQYELKFKIDEVAFKNGGLLEVQRMPIADPKPIPKMHVSVAKAIQEILKRIPVATGACYQTRDDHILITTPIRQLITVETTVESLPLWEFLDYLEDKFGFKIDRTLTKDKENKLVRIVAISDVRLGLLATRVFRQVGLEAEEEGAELVPLPSGGGIGGLGGMGGPGDGHGGIGGRGGMHGLGGGGIAGQPRR